MRLPCRRCVGSFDNSPARSEASMSLARIYYCSALLLAMSGCKTAQRTVCAPMQRAPVAVAAKPLSSSPLPAVVRSSYQNSSPSPQVPPVLQGDNQQQEIFVETLSREWLQSEIEARNPSLEAMIAAWQAAAQIYPQRVALD